ncbi:MAG TPA: metal ABC transporter substrate-binding protein [Nocardioides sp.]|nr:metal ABC transporter substrate-binding protein [Nocardioides sp.]
MLRVALCSLPLVLTGCGAVADTGGGVQVAAGFYPLQYVAERVGGDQARVEVLTAPGGEPHDASLSVRETALVAESDVLVVAGGVQPAVDDAVDTAAGEGIVVDPSEPDFETGDAPVIRADDPHFWLDPLLMADLGDAVAEALVDSDPEHADAYRDHAADLRRDLERLDRAYREGLAGCDRRTVVVSHDAFGYLDRYGLEFAPIAGLSPGAEPTPADLARLQALIREEGITTVFSERLVSPRVAESLADDLDIRTAVLDPVEGLSDETQDENYLTLMRANLAALQKANGC